MVVKKIKIIYKKKPDPIRYDEIKSRKNKTKKIVIVKNGNRNIRFEEKKPVRKKAT